MNNSISVVVCSFQGERFIRSQLDSLRTQTRRADEIIVNDDGSSDATCDIVQTMAATTSEISFAKNDQNKGVRLNFQAGIRRSLGDIIFLCDQDDIWEAEKLEKVAQLFEAYPDFGYVFTDAIRVDEADRSLTHRLWESLALPFGPKEQQQFRETGGFEPLLRGYFVTGCTLAFRAEFKDLILPIPETWMHDAWIALCISAVSKGYPFAEPLVRYRQHTTQQIGERKRSWLEQYRVAKKMGQASFEKRLAGFQDLRERLTTQNQWPIAQKVLQLLNLKIEFLAQRVAMRRRGFRLVPVLGHWMRSDYARFAEGWKAVAQDLFLP